LRRTHNRGRAIECEAVSALSTYAFFRICAIHTLSAHLVAEPREGTEMLEAEFWSGPMGRLWAAHADALDGQLELPGNEGLRVLRAAPGERILDLGCGSGGIVAKLCDAVAPDGAVVGLDISADQIEVARRRVRSDLARFEVGDAETFDFGQDRFDALFSRFGCMFFSDPVKAFGNVRGAMKPGARAVLVVWREPKLNPWAKVPAELAAEMLGPAEPAPPDAPGLFSWASPSVFKPILENAGFSDVEWSERQTTLKLSEQSTADPLEQAVNMSFRIGPLARRMRDQPDDLRAEAARRLAPRLRPFLSDGWVRMPGTIWIVRARR
jgi:SAM-dependent methyltransferase